MQEISGMLIMCLTAPKAIVQWLEEWTSTYEWTEFNEQIIDLNNMQEIYGMLIMCLIAPKAIVQ